MCGRYALAHPPEDLAEIFGTWGDLPDFPARYNIAPSQAAPVVVGSSRGPRLGLVPWGFLRDPTSSRGAGLIVNLRVEGLRRRGRFQDAFAHRRCLVPMSGFYEWRAEGATKVPHLVRPDAEPVLAAGGVWERFASPEDGAPEQSRFVVLTRAPGPSLADLHHRAPVLVPRAEWPRWLGTDEDPDSVAKAASGWPEPPLRIHPVSTHVNRTAHDDAACVEPAGPDLPPPRPESKTAR